MTSRERMLTALHGEMPDYTPCSFMIFTNLRRKSKNEREFVESQLAMGLDAFTHVGFLKPSYHPEVSEKIWKEKIDNKIVFHRRLDTPRGALEQIVRQEYGWPREDDFCIFNDLGIPRAEKYLVDPELDLEKLTFIFGPFTDEAIMSLRESAEVAEKLSKEYELLLVGGWSSINTRISRDDGVMGADALFWLSGFEKILLLEMDKPDLIREYLRIIHEWNMKQIQIYLENTNADLIIRRGWYETTEFWTPQFYRDNIAPILKEEVELVHQADRLFGLIITSAFMPILNDILGTGIDVLIGLDPKEGKGTDILAVKKIMRQHKRCIWGGVSGAMTVEQGSREEVDREVRKALNILGDGGGFILSPVDNVREDTELAWDNTRQFIESWKKYILDCSKHLSNKIKKRNHYNK